MIAVIAKTGEADIVREFFELFKTPWEFYVPHRPYDVVVVTSGEVPADLCAKLLLIYSSKTTFFDSKVGIVATRHQRSVRLEWNATEFPIYGDMLAFEPNGRDVLWAKEKSDVVGLLARGTACATVRMGYDLFEEIGFLFAKGQPPEDAPVPTAEIHISLLRNLILSAGIPVVEIPPVPPGYDFMACLTHDVDFIGIRQHKCDRTMWGFLYRACLESPIKALNKGGSWRKVVQNWKAALSLPFVHLGLMSDFWLEFDRYCELEKDLASTFFVLPYKNRPGQAVNGRVDPCRAAKYEVGELKKEVRELVGKGCEVGLHGIDAWQDGTKALDESRRIHETVGQSLCGVRMHWLFFAENSARALEKGGLLYDSTVGYNDAVGFRAGTTQVFRPLGADTLLELPLNIQDTALFYRDRMNLSEDKAMESCEQLVHSMVTFGGVLTVNWHTRSLSPERLWGDFYRRLLQHLRSYHVWFGTGQEITEWFRVRRSLQFGSVEIHDDFLRVRLSGAVHDQNCPLLVRVYEAESAGGANSTFVCPRETMYSEILWEGQSELELARKLVV